MPAFLFFVLSLFFCAPCSGQLNTDKKLRAEKLISLFENGTTEIQYGYAENLHDGRGITCGRAGFTSADGDLYELVALYVKKNHSTPLRRYLGALRVLAAQHSFSTARLAGFISAFKKEAQNHLFQESQDRIQDKLYYAPEVSLAKKVGVESPIGNAILYDMEIQHGDGNDPDGVRALIQKTLRNLHAPRIGNHASEVEFLNELLKVRKLDLLHPFDSHSNADWSDSIDRVEVLQQILDERNLELEGPLVIHTPHYQEILE